MALIMERIGDCGVINLVMWVVALSLKGELSYNEPPFSKSKKSVVFASKLYVRHFLRVS